MKKSYLDNYLECESLHHELFEKIDFCVKSNCIKNTEFMGCCLTDWFAPEESDDEVYFFLHNERLRIYGPPKTEGNGCGYHDIDGCVLKTHKHPVCVACMCPSMLDYLKELGLNYTISGNGDKLRKVLEGKLKGRKLRKYKLELKGFLLLVPDSFNHV